MRCPRRFVALAVCALACGSKMKVATKYDSATDFTSYRTYAWMPWDPKVPQPTDARVLAAPQLIDEQLKPKGLVKVPIDASPDLVVNAYGWTADKTQVYSSGYAYMSAPGYYYYPTMVVPGAVSETHYQDGTLIIDFIDARTKQLVWQGTATDTFNPGEGPNILPTAIRQTLDQYPPPR